MNRPWTIEWRSIPGVIPRKGCLTCKVPEEAWTTFRRYPSEVARDRAWEGFQTQKKRWQTTYEIRKAHDAQ